MVPGVESADPCPCGSGRPLEQCCGPFIRGIEPAPTAQALMRSRYTAYVLGESAYLLATWDPRTRPESLELSTDQHWLGLKLLRSEGGGSTDDAGEVEFVARFKVAGRATRLHEISRFRRESGRWLYVDGTRGSTDSSLRH